MKRTACMLSLAVGIAAGQSAVPIPKVTGPIPVTKDSYPLTAADRGKKRGGILAADRKMTRPAAGAKNGVCAETIRIHLLFRVDPALWDKYSARANKFSIRLLGLILCTTPYSQQLVAPIHEPK